MSIRKGNDIIAKSVIGATELTTVLANYAATTTLASYATTTELTSHTSSTTNPHSVTKSQIGLGNLTNDLQLKDSDTTVTKQGNTFNGNSQLVQTTSTGKLPAVDGSLLTAVPSTVANTSLSNLTTAGKAVISNLPMPSSSYIDLTLGASGSTYTAPTDGWLHLRKVVTATSQFAQFNTGICIMNSQASTIGYPVNLLLPVKGGTVTTIYYDAAGTTELFRFIYAEGSKP